jgi:TolB-like protein
MKLIYINLLLIVLSINGFAQTSKVAILDFENTSGKTEYDALGKAISSMLISDLTNNIDSKKIEFYERSQLNKLLDEQKLQKSKNFDAKTAVNFGKLSGVNYVLVGSVFVMDKICNLSSKLVDVQTSKILISKEINGKIEDCLKLKTQLAHLISNELSSKNGITCEIKSEGQISISKNSLLLYANGINFMDKGEIDSANVLLTELKYTEKEFLYTESQLIQLYENASKMSANNSLRQKAYILNLHKRISNNPAEAWQQIETFWNGPLDEKYPYLEYLFLKNVFEMFKKDTLWLNHPVSRHGVNTVLGDMILFSISNHASMAQEIQTAIYYNELRVKKFPSSEISIIWGEPIDPSKYRLALIENPNKDTMFYPFLLLAQEAIINGLGSRNEAIMKGYLASLEPILDKPFHEFISSEYYFPILDKKIPIFNPYNVLGTLLILVGNDAQKLKAEKFYKLNSDKKINEEKLSEISLFKGKLENSMLLKNAAIWNGSSFNDYESRNWTKSDFSKNIIAILHVVTLQAMCLQTVNKHVESYEILKTLHSTLSNDVSFWVETEIWQGISLQKIYYTLQLKNCISLGKMDDVKFISRQMQLLGLDPNEYVNLHTEFYD